MINQEINNGEMIADGATRFRERYRLLLIPGLEVAQRLREERYAFDAQFMNNRKLAPEPSITVGMFDALPDMEETIVRWMQRAIGQTTAFPVALNNYGAAPHHRIHVRVANSPELKLLEARLTVVDDYMRANGCSAIHWQSKPYLSLAEDLSPDVYEAGISFYSPKTFGGSFLANELVLVKGGTSSQPATRVSLFRTLPAMAI